MLPLLKQRELGLFNSAEVKSFIANHRSQNLCLSDLKEFVNAHGSSFNSLDLDSIENRYLLASAGNGAISIYDLYTLKEKPNVISEPVCTIGRSHANAHKHSVETVQWYPVDAGMFLASGGDGDLKVWDPNILLPAETFRLEKFIYSHHMSPIATEHSMVAVGMESPYVRLVDLRTGSDGQILTGHTGDVLCVCWSPKKPYELASGSKDNKVFMWDVRMAVPNYLVFDQHNGAVKKVSKQTVNTAHSGSVLGMSFTPDGNHLLTYGSDNQLRLWDANSGKNLQRNYGKCSNQSRRCLKLAVSDSMVQPCVYLPEGNSIQVMDVFTGTHIKTLSGHYSQVNCSCHNPATQELYSGSNDKHLLMWTPDGEAEIAYTEYLKNPNKISEPVRKVEPQQQEADQSQASMLAQSEQLQDTWSSDEDN